MIITVDMMKEALGMATTPDPVNDPVMERSAAIAQALVEAYIGTTIEQNYDRPQWVRKFHEIGIQTVRLRHWPATLISATLDGTAVPADQYDFHGALGALEFKQQRAYVGKLEIKYVEGYVDDEIPKDIIDATLHLSLSVYENGGKLSAAASSSAGALKSLTMFDAMSMSFDTGATASTTTGPEALPAQWAFVLDKYRVNTYVMG